MADIVITITCPVCEKAFEKKAKDMPDGTVVVCPKCGEKTTIRGDMFSKMVDSVNKPGADFKRPDDGFNS